MSEKKENRLKQAFVNQTHGYLDVFSKRELFNEITRLFNGNLVARHTQGKVLTSFSISIPYRKWMIELSESDTRPLKLQVNFETRSDYELVLSQEDAIDKILKKFGKPEVSLGNTEFDERYLIKSDNSAATLRILSGEIRDILLLYNVSSISITRGENNKTILVSAISRTLDDIKSYTDIIRLHQLLIDKLEEAHII